MRIRFVLWSVVVTLVSAASGGFAGSWFSSACGQARVPQEADAAGVVCLSVCSEISARVSCAIPGQDLSGVRASTRSGQAPVNEIKSFGLEIRPGRRVTIAELARQLRELLGWELSYGQMEDSAELAAVIWSGPWSDLGRLEIRTRDGRSFWLRPDGANHRLELRGGSGIGVKLGS